MATGTSRGLYALLAGVIVALGVAALLMPSLVDNEIPLAMMTSLPAPPSGWAVGGEPPRAQQFSDIAIGGVSRTYVRNDLTVTVTVSRSKQGVLAARAAGVSITDPQMRAVLGDRSSGTTYGPIERDGWEGWTAIADEGEATAIAYRADVLVQLTCTPPRAGAIALFLEGLDWEVLDELAAAAGE